MVQLATEYNKTDRISNNQCAFPYLQSIIWQNNDNYSLLFDRKMPGTILFSLSVMVNIVDNSVAVHPRGI